jgi:tetratricopeptide (TPR) repeat protein
VESRLVLFSGKDIEVFSCEDFATDESLVITFTSRSDLPHKSGFGEKFFQKNQQPAIHFVSKRNHWWQVEELMDAIEQVAPRTSRYKNVCSYGSSMGGYGALLCSGVLGVNTVIAGSPQFAINNRLVPWPPRWERDTQGVVELYQMEDYCSKDAKLICVYDPFEELDRLHVRELSKHRMIHHLPTHFSGHSAILYLQRLGLLNRLVIKAFTNKLELTTLAQEIKGLRRNNLLFLQRLMHFCLKKSSRSSVASWAESQALIVAKRKVYSHNEPVNHLELFPFMKAYSKKQILLGNKDAALKLASDYCDNFPDIVWSHELLSYVYWKMKNYDDALLEARRALRLNRKNPSLRLMVARLYLINGNLDEADYHFSNSLKFYSKDKSAWVAALKDVTNYGGELLKFELEIVKKIVEIDPDWKA